MAFTVSKTDVWTAEIADQPGALAAKLDALTKAGVDLDGIVARRQGEKPGTGVIFLCGIKGAKQGKAAAAAGFTKSPTLGGLYIQGPNKPGGCQRIARAAATAGVNLRGLSAGGVGTKFTAFVGF